MRSVALEYKRRYLMALSEGKTPQQAVAEVAHDQSVKYHSVLKGLNRAGIQLKPSPKAWTAKDEQRLARMCMRGEWSKVACAAFPGRTRTAVRAKCVYLRRRFPDLPCLKQDYMGVTMPAHIRAKLARAA